MRFALSVSFLVLATSSVTGCLVYDSSLLENLSEAGGTGGNAAATGGADPLATGGVDVFGGANTGGAVSSDGGSATGGGEAAGSGGADAPMSESLLDGFDDMNAAIENEAGRTGTWMAYNDGSVGGVMSPGPGQAFEVELREDTNFALHVVATGFDTWGVGYFSSLSEGTGVDDKPGPYDLLAEGYNAVRFWAKKAPGKASILLIKIADESSSTSGSCPEISCAYDHAEGLVSLKEEWTEFTLRFSDMAKKSSPLVEFDKAYEFHILQNSSDIDFWIDDIRFIELPAEE